MKTSRLFTIVLIFTAATIAVTQEADAVNWSPLVGDGNWADAANWGDGTFYPGQTNPNDDGIIDQPVVVTLNSAIPQILKNIQLSGSNPGQLDIQAGADVTAGSAMTQGIQLYSGTINQSGGTVNVRHMWARGGQSGTYNLSGGTLNTVKDLRAAKNNSDVGTFNISGTGVANVGEFLSIGVGVNSVGVFTQSGGTVNLLNTHNSNPTTGKLMQVSAQGTGSALFHQSGGVFNNAANGHIFMQQLNTASAEFRLTGGTFNANGGLIQNTKSNVAQQGIFTFTGGTLNMGGGDLRTSVGNSANANGQVFNVTGATFTGVNELWGGLNMNTDSTFIVGADRNAASLTTIAASNRGELNLILGSVVFPVFGNNSASQLDNPNVFQQGLLDLSGGTIQIEFDSGYTPLAGHSFDLIANTPGGKTTLSTANIASTSYDGLWNVTWDTSQWLSDGILTIDSVTVIPEPASLILLAAGGLAVLRRRAA